MALTGTEIWALLKPLDANAREAKIRSLFDAGEIPKFLSTSPWPRVTVEGTGADGIFRTLSYYPAPMFFALGTDDDPAYMPTLPATFQYIAQKMKCVIPSQKMAKDIYAAANTRMALADVKLAPYFNLDIGKTLAFEQSSKIITSAAVYRLPSETNLIDGCKKNVITGPKQDGSHVLIYGGQKQASDGGGFPQQPYSGDAHGWFYVDYSHGDRLVLDACFLDGKSAKLSEIALDPKTAYLVNDQKELFQLCWPNTGTGSKASTIENPGGSSSSVPPVAGREPMARNDAASRLTLGETTLVFLAFVGSISSIVSLGRR